MQATINGIRMNYRVEGAEAAPPVVLHHSLAMNLTLWDELAAALLPRYRVVRFDARGHGQTEATKAPYDFETLSADVVGADGSPEDRARAFRRAVDGRHGGPVPRPHPSAALPSLTLASTSSRVPPEAGRCGRSASRTRARRASNRRWRWRCRAG